MSHVFRHPKYYEELRKIRKQARPAPDPIVVSEEDLKALEEIDKQQAASNKPQASSAKQAQMPDASVKPQAQRVKRQATSVKLPDA